MAADPSLEAATGSSKAEGVVTVREATQRRAWWKFGGTDVSYVSVDAGYKDVSSENSSSNSLPSLVENKDNVFVDGTAQELYRPPDNYEGYHRFDPYGTWTQAEEKRLLWRVSNMLRREYQDSFFCSSTGL